MPDPTSSPPHVPGQPHTGLIQPLIKRGFQPIGRLEPRLAQDITGSPWSIGCECCDRDYVSFEHVGPYLGELGAKAVRLQAGWAKCDPGDGTYRWNWLDQCVDGSLAQGVQPWLQTSYGNPAYPGGGGIGLSQGIPTSDEALNAWVAWIGAMVERYKDRVHDWEIWNEPDNHNANPAEAYAAFFIRTAEVIRARQPDANIIGLSLAGGARYAKAVLKIFASQGKADLLNELAFHFYPHNPDHDFDKVEQLARLLELYAPHATLRQGETGAMAQSQPFMALRQYEWSYRKQAAWNVRRMVAHHARGIPANLFQLSDMWYEKRGGAVHEGYNPKGQLKTRPDLTVESKRPSFFAVRNLFGLLDNAYPLAPLDEIKVRSSRDSVAYLWHRSDRRTPNLAMWWHHDQPPGLEDSPLGDAAVPGVVFDDPVLLDLFSGRVFGPPVSCDELYDRLPITDTPLALAERDTLRVVPGD
jgi:hypothetical protein